MFVVIFFVSSPNWIAVQFVIAHVTSLSFDENVCVWAKDSVLIVIERENPLKKTIQFVKVRRRRRIEENDVILCNYRLV